MQDDKIFQEFYCGNCQGYIRFRLAMHYDRQIIVICPKCKHRHDRCIVNGIIKEQGRTGNGTEEIIAPRSAYSTSPISIKMEKSNKRDAQVVKTSEDVIRDNFMREKWIETYGK